MCHAMMFKGPWTLCFIKKWHNWSWHVHMLKKVFFRSYRKTLVFCEIESFQKKSKNVIFLKHKNHVFYVSKTMKHGEEHHLTWWVVQWNSTVMPPWGMRLYPIPSTASGSHHTSTQAHRGGYITSDGSDGRVTKLTIFGDQNASCSLTLLHM